MDLLKDSNGFPYYEELPDNARPGKVSDFIEIDPDLPDYHKVKYGQKYLLYSPERIDGTKEDRYYLREVTEGTEAKNMEPFIKAKRLFLLVD